MASWELLTAGALIIRLGQMLYLCGLSRSKNAAEAGIRAIVDLCLAILCFWAVGIAILVGSRRFLFGGANAFTGQGIFFASLVPIATFIPVSAMAGRAKFSVMFATTAVMAGVVVPICWRFTFTCGNLFHGMNYTDQCGAGFLHVVGGVWALVGAIAVGTRSGKRNADGSSNMIPGHSVPLAAAGLLAMIVGYLPYVVGTAVSVGLAENSPALAAGNLLLSTAAAGVTALIFTRCRYGKPDLYLIFAGVFGGVVAMTAAPAALDNYAAVLVGAAAGLLVPYTMVLLDLRCKIDDPVGVIAIHGVGGAWSVLSAGLLMHGTPMQRLHHLGMQALGLAAVAFLALIAAAPTLAIVKAVVGLRARESDEYDGLDLAELDINAYPDFQQTMIKSYHMREA